MRVGDKVTVLVKVLSEPPIDKGTRCMVVGITEDRQKVFVEGPSRQVVSVKRGDVSCAKR